MGEYIGWVIVDPGVERKINKKHQLTVADVREAFQWPARAQGFWEDHERHGLRYVIKGTNSAGRVILGALQPVDETDGTWALRTARART